MLIPFIDISVPAALSTTPSSNTVVLEEGSSLDLNCSTTGCPDPNVTWTKEGLSNHIESKIGGLLMHRFTSLAKSDLGTYVCTVDNGVIGSPVVKKVFVNVTRELFLNVITLFLLELFSLSFLWLNFCLLLLSMRPNVFVFTAYWAT